MTDPFRELASDYSRRAEGYARLWAPVIHPMARPLLEAMPLAGVKRILDVGTGSGGLWPLIRREAPDAAIYGIDASEGMLRAGGDLLRGRAAVMDAQQLGIRLRSFDAALLLFVLFHVSDPRAALREVLAALRPAGTLGLVVWGEDPGLPGRDIWSEELDRVGAAPDPRDPSVMRQALMDTPEKLTDLIERNGFTAERVWSQRFVHAWAVDSLLATQTNCGLPSRRLESMDADARSECTSRVRARLERLTPAELEYRVEIICAIARRPG
ncbi:MAG: class I SAM-dependent methyltransferase [Gemmatimonadaceae bacterium]